MNVIEHGFSGLCVVSAYDCGGNVGYGLMIKKIAKMKLKNVWTKYLTLSTRWLWGRKPAQLSGGQRQRVALAGH